MLVCEAGVNATVQGLIVIENAWDAEHPLLSFTVTVKLNVPLAVAAPLSNPEVESVNPGGNAPAVTL